MFNLRRVFHVVKSRAHRDPSEPPRSIRNAPLIYLHRILGSVQQNPTLERCILFAMSKPALVDPVVADNPGASMNSRPIDFRVLTDSYPITGVGRVSGEISLIRTHARTETALHGVHRRTANRTILDTLCSWLLVAAPLSLRVENLAHLGITQCPNGTDERFQPVMQGACIGSHLGMKLQQGAVLRLYKATAERPDKVQLIVSRPLTTCFIGKLKLARYSRTIFLARILHLIFYSTSAVADQFFVEGMSIDATRQSGPSYQSRHPALG